VRNTERVASSYYKLLSSIDWNDEVLVYGLKEGLNKFISNAYIKLNNRNKLLQGDYYSQEAIDKISAGNFDGLIYEHMVPKSKYIQSPCINMAKNGTLTVSQIVNLLDQYWKIAVITKEQDKLLSRTKMPDDWDGKNIMARYIDAGIHLVPRAL